MCKRVQYHCPVCEKNRDYPGFPYEHPNAWDFCNEYLDGKWPGAWYHFCEKWHELPEHEKKVCPEADQNPPEVNTTQLTKERPCGSCRPMEGDKGKLFHPNIEMK